MTVSAEHLAIVSRSRSSLRLVYWASLAWLAASAWRLVMLVLKYAGELHSRRAGIALGFDPELPEREPALKDYHVFGAPYVAPGSQLVIDHVRATVAHVPVSSIIVSGLGDLLALLTGVGVALCLGLLARHVLSGAPFLPSTVRALVALAIIVMVGLEAASVLHYVGSQLVGQVVLLRPQPSDGTFSFTGQQQVIIPFEPLYLGAAILGLAAVFRVGARLQKDTEGLV